MVSDRNPGLLACKLAAESVFGVAGDLRDALGGTQARLVLGSLPCSSGGGASSCQAMTQRSCPDSFAVYMTTSAAPISSCGLVALKPSINHAAPEHGRVG